jgi:hypothetical protein
VTDRGAQLIVLAGYVNELTQPIPHDALHDVYDPVSHRRKTMTHHTDQPSLLDQLRQALVPAPDQDEGASTGGSYESRPPLNSDALDCLMRIEAWSARWVSVGLSMALRPDVEGNLRALVGAGAAMEDDRLDSLVWEVRSWHVWARTVTDWQAPPWRPHCPCPHCEHRGGLRVKLDTHTAVCTACGAVWGPESIGILADHVRECGEDQRVAAV